MPLKYLYNSAALLILFIEKNKDTAKAKVKHIIGKHNFLSVSYEVLLFLSQNKSMAMSVKECTEFIQG
ncbi:MAG: hypothetical protein KJ710_03085 [Candidatus Omnitrophica bacterium]|nr:hypothetical protein [Candidatus Omnitrophota bacterium]MBU1923234.1 hypothetical protein [Candidatus Omnitrophota bacterium]